MPLDSKIAVAVMEKARRVFSPESGDIFLSFSLTPISFTKKQLNSIANCDISDEAVWDFSQYVNSIPTGLIWNPDGRFLWEIYDDLNEVKLASAIRTDQEDADYQKAIQFLHEIKADGSQDDSIAVKTYRAYRDNLIMAWQDYNQEKSIADNSNDPSAKKKWNEIVEPALSTKLTEINKLWVTDGYKDQVEEALRIEEAAGSRSPELTWSKWMNRFMPVDFKTSAKSGRVCMPSGFAPTNAFESGSWQNFTLDESESNNLILQAPAELRNRLAPGGVDLDIESLSFEYNSVAVTRPWLSTDIFKARFWKFYDNSKMLSDGKIPPSGLYPAYVAALVFVRNLAIKLKPDSPKNSKAMETLNAKGGLNLGFFVATPLTKEASARNEITLYNKRMMANGVVEAADSLDETKAPLLTQSSASEVASGDRPTLMRSTNLAGSRDADKIKHAAAKSSVSKMQLNNFMRIDSAKKAALASATEKKTSQPPVQSSDDFMIMAFICKRLPMSPNPDQTLQW